MRAIYTVTIFIFWIGLGHSATSGEFITPPNNIKCNEYMELQKRVAETHAVLTQDVATINLYLGWGIGYVQGKSPNLLPDFIKYFGGPKSPDGDFPIYIAYVANTYLINCRGNENMRLEEVLDIAISQFPAMINLRLE